jgi:hypothetical protein
LKGLGGMALLGTFRTAFSAARNRVNASGPSCISALGFTFLWYSDWSRLESTGDEMQKRSDVSHCILRLRFVERKSSMSALVSPLILEASEIKIQR